MIMLSFYRFIRKEDWLIICITPTNIILYRMLWKYRKFRLVFKFYLHIDEYIQTYKIYFEFRISEIKQQCLIIDLDFYSKKVEQIFHTFTFSTCLSATLLANITYWHISMTTAFSDEIFFLYRSSPILKNSAKFEVAAKHCFRLTFTCYDDSTL